ncbi:MAG: hypothetical protein P9M15_04915, partial [Candidatus Electryoneaceae bacterium]|nr:hypothetical protein [Candidatus Electryoneaceae bacterium]
QAVPDHPVARATQMPTQKVTKIFCYQPFMVVVITLTILSCKLIASLSVLFACHTELRAI